MECATVFTTPDCPSYSLNLGDIPNATPHSVQVQQSQHREAAVIFAGGNKLVWL